MPWSCSNFGGRWGRKFALFSGVEWDFDSSLGLKGYCDFLLDRGPSQHILQAPFIAIVEAKNDLIQTGLGPCIAAMVAARMSNERSGLTDSTVHGAFSTGAAWKFLRRKGDIVALDVPESFIDILPKIMGILREMVEGN